MSLSRDTADENTTHVGVGLTKLAERAIFMVACQNNMNTKRGKTVSSSKHKHAIEQRQPGREKEGRWGRRVLGV